jgi:CHASE2 domain-containing sensor protein
VCCGLAAILAAGSSDRMDPTWPPVLIAAVVVILLLAVAVVTTMFRRLRAAARDQRVRPRGWEP